ERNSDVAHFMRRAKKSSAYECGRCLVLFQIVIEVADRKKRRVALWPGLKRLILSVSLPHKNVKRPGVAVGIGDVGYAVAIDIERVTGNVVLWLKTTVPVAKKDAESADRGACAVELGSLHNQVGLAIAVYVAAGDQSIIGKHVGRLDWRLERPITVA